MAPKKVVIGSGTFGEVYKTRINKKKLVAVKRIHDNLSWPGTIGQQTVLKRWFYHKLQPLNHPNIVRTLDVKAKLSSRKINLVIIMEPMDVNLASMIANAHVDLDLEITTKWCCEIAKGLEYLHSLPTPIVHRNLSPQNVLLKYENERMKVKIGDAGMAEAYQESGIRVARFHPIDDRYMAPESAGYLCSPRIRFDPSMDIYSLGIIMLEMINGTPPDTKAYPFDREAEEMWEAVLSKEMRKLDRNPLRSLIHRVVGMPQRRPTADQIVKALQEKQTIKELRCLDFQNHIAEIEEMFCKWIPLRKATISRLDSLGLDAMINKLKDVHRKVANVTTGTATVAAVGGLVMVGTAIANIFTGGIAGTAIQIAHQTAKITRQAAKAGTQAARGYERNITNTEVQKIEFVVARDILESKKLRLKVSTLSAVVLGNVERFYADPDDWDMHECFAQLAGQRNILRAHASTSAGQHLLRSAGAAAESASAPVATITGAFLGKELASFAVKGLPAIGNVYHDVGTAATILSLPLDILAVTLALKGLQEKSNCEAAEWIQRVRAQMTCDLEPDQVHDLVMAYIGELANEKVKNLELKTDRFFKDL